VCADNRGAAMNNHLVALVVWLSLVIGGYLAIDHFSAPDPVVRSSANGGAEIVVPVARDGHFYLEGAVNGTPVTFLVDTGASYVSIGSDLAARANLPEGVAGFFGTANGSVEGRIVRSQTVRADVFEVSGITVAVMPARSEFGLLGQNFLRYFTVSQSDGRLVLRMREP
jgi:aspartyl protease family protein